MEKYCLYHPGIIGKVFCKRCNGYLCEKCTVKINGKLCCKKCYHDYLTIHQNKQQKSDTINNKINQSAQKINSDSSNSDQIYFRKKRKHPILKNFLAIIIGTLCAYFIRFIIAYIIIIISKSEIPADVTILLDIFISFFAGSLASSFVPSKGWLIGLLTQILQIAVLITIVFSKIFEYNYFTVSGWEIRLVIFCIISATIAGHVTDKYRRNLWSFIHSVLTFITGSIFFIFEIVSFILYIFPFFWAGKILIEQKNVVEALLVFFILGPIISTIISGILLGIIYGITQAWTKIFNWFVEDIETKEYNSRY